MTPIILFKGFDKVAAMVQKKKYGSIALAILTTVSCVVGASHVFAQQVDNAAKAENTFGINAFKRFAQGNKSGNLFISPLSLHSCLQLAYNGADGSTAQEMRKALALSSADVSKTNKDYKNFITSLTTMPEFLKDGGGMGDPMLRLELANSIWGDKATKFKPDYLKVCKEYFKTQVESLDFRSPKSVSRINQWVNEKTHGKIPTIIQSLNPLDMVVLVNTAYFKARWLDEFSKQQT
ncbi:MAG: hypothetical protein K2Z81_23875, partial [Cyanobacteria bacterium]|nr:hypothetical protein [Cyanobacteriota bacterium]